MSFTFRLLLCGWLFFMVGAGHGERLIHVMKCIDAASHNAKMDCRQRYNTTKVLLVQCSEDVRTLLMTAMALVHQARVLEIWPPGI